MGVLVRSRHCVRIVTAAVATAVALAGLTGCGVLRRAIVGSGSSGPRPAPRSSAAYSMPPTYSPDATGEVVGTNCRYDESAQQFKFDLSIQNASADHTFKYSITITFSGGDNPFSDDNFGSQFEDVTVGPGRDRTLVVSQGYSMTKRTYYGCTVKTATKVLAD
jgi:hypothetical protein